MKEVLGRCFSYSQIPKKTGRKKSRLQKFSFSCRTLCFILISKNVSMMIETEEEINKRKKEAVQFILKSIHDNLVDFPSSNFLFVLIFLEI